MKEICLVQSVNESYILIVSVENCPKISAHVGTSYPLRREHFAIPSPSFLPSSQFYRACVILLSAEGYILWKFY